MSAPPELIALVRQWLQKASHDLINAEHTLKLPDDECPLDTVCFHAQQCAEKYLKARTSAWFDATARAAAKAASAELAAADEQRTKVTDKILAVRAAAPPAEAVPLTPPVSTFVVRP